MRASKTSVLVTLLCSMMSTAGYSLQGKRVLVTGSSGGIGKGIALALAREGCSVLVHYNVRAEGAAQTKRDIEQGGGSCAGVVQCDFRDPKNIHRMFQDNLANIWPEGMDILVNNAGIVRKMALEDDDSDLSTWHEILSVNLNAPRLLSHLAMPLMARRGGGVILNVSSIHGEKSNEYISAYAVSKSGLESLTRAMAIEYAAHNIRVNAIAPGVVPVERSAESFSIPANVKAWADHIPLRRLGTPAEIAQAAMPLLTNEWVTGAIWQVDGGMMARSNMPDRERPSSTS